ncbi:MAG: hypothetical protein NVSMB66_4160 [Candidatus Doudnabacteria bacterium]
MEISRLLAIQTVKVDTPQNYEKGVCQEAEAMREWRILERVSLYPKRINLGLTPAELKLATDRQSIRLAKVLLNVSRQVEEEIVYFCDHGDVSLFSLLKRSLQEMEKRGLPFNSLDPSFMTADDAFVLFYELRRKIAEPLVLRIA